LRRAAPANVARPDLSYYRSIAAGLILLLLVTVDATSSVLVQPFTDDVAGTLPALNVPGPKLWAVPLLQRPIGRRPELPGMVGTRCALLSLLAVWLLTARPRQADDASGGTGGASGSSDWLRPAARWTSAILFGVAFGTMLAAQGLWPSELPAYRLGLVGGVELPAAALLYAQLRALAARVPGRERRALLDLLRWLVPSVVAAGALLIASTWFRDNGTPLFRGSNRFAVSVAYGVAAVTCGVVATAAVGSLAVAYCAAAFPDAWRVASGTRRLARASWRWFSSADALRLRFGCVAAGLALLVLVAVLGNDRVLWYTARDTPTANLPFFNFPGPKLFASAALPEMGRETVWEAICSQTVLVVLNLAAFWLITVRLDRREGVVLRALVRWLPVLSVGVAMGCGAAWQAAESARRASPLFSGVRRTAVFVVVTVLLELPSTFLLYAYLARLAALYAGGRSLHRQLRLAALAVPAVVLASLAVFTVSRGYRDPRAAPAMLAAAGAFGAVAVGGALWTASLALTLAGGLVRRRAARAGGVFKTVYRELPRPHEAAAAAAR
jgi:hypothetical protein